MDEEFFCILKLKLQLNAEEVSLYRITVCDLRTFIMLSNIINRSLDQNSVLSSVCYLTPKSIFRVFCM